jgi:alkylation response protein AidB-like acyl-CoA dehydrogenase
VSDARSPGASEAARPGLDLELDPAQRALADAVETFCRDRFGDAALRNAGGVFPLALWRELAELGVLGLAAPEGDGGALELVAASEALGRAVFPGPLAATAFAAQVLPRDERRAAVEGRSLVSLGAPPLLPWAPLAGIFVELDEGRAWQARPRGPVEAVATLGGEPWGRVALERGPELAGVERALHVEGIARAAYLAAAGDRLVGAAAEHARTRHQFGRPIGDFQAVAHPLADAFVRLRGAATLARAAASAFDAGDPALDELAAVARLSAACAALDAAHVAFQVFGAQGVMLDGPVFAVARRIRQLVSQPPTDEGARAAALAPYLSGRGAAEGQGGLQWT